MDKEYLKRVGIYILSALLSLCLIFYLGYHVWRSFTKEVQTQPVTESSVEHTVTVEGYIFRTERPLLLTGSATTEGNTLFPLYSDGTKLAKGDIAARLYAGDRPDLQEQLRQIDGQIALLQECVDGDLQSIKDSRSIDRDISDILSGLRADGDSGRATGSAAGRTAFLTAVNKRLLLSGTGSDLHGQIAALQEQRRNLTEGFGALLETVPVPIGGYYYAQCDGYESVYTADFLKDGELGYTALAEKLAAPPMTEARAAGKLCTDSQWYLVCMLDDAYQNDFEEKRFCTVVLGAGDAFRLEMDVERLLPGEDRFALVLSTREMPADFDFARVQTVRFVTEEYVGFRIPVNAVRVVDGITGVYVLEGSTVRFRAVSPLYSGEGYYIVETNPEADPPKDLSWLSQHESLITEGKALYDGKVLSG